MVAIDLITENIRMKLQQPDLRRIYPNLEVIPSNFQIRGMHTIIRDENTTTSDFVFYADRLLRLVCIISCQVNTYRQFQTQRNELCNLSLGFDDEQCNWQKVAD